VQLQAEAGCAWAIAVSATAATIQEQIGRRRWQRSG
jgi:hypothetical protein